MPVQLRQVSGAGGGAGRIGEREWGNMFTVATTNTSFVGDRAKVELLWLKNREQGILGPKSLGFGLLVHMVGHIEKQCGRLTDEEARLFSAWCATHEEKNTV